MHTCPGVRRHEGAWLCEIHGPEHRWDEIAPGYGHGPLHDAGGRRWRRRDLVTTRGGGKPETASGWRGCRGGVTARRGRVTGEVTRRDAWTE